MADRFNVATIPFGLTTYRTPIHCASIPPARAGAGSAYASSRWRAPCNIGRRHIEGTHRRDNPQEENEMRNRKPTSYRESRRDFVRLGLGIAGGLALPAGFVREAFGQDKAPIGTWP